MKSICLAFAAIIATTTAAWATPAPATPLTYTQLFEIVQSASDDPRTLKSLAGAHIVLDLRPSAIRPHFIAINNAHGIAFTCQLGFESFAGGPVTATLIAYEPGEDGRDHVTLTGCTAQER